MAVGALRVRDSDRVDNAIRVSSSIRRHRITCARRRGPPPTRRPASGDHGDQHMVRAVPAATTRLILRHPVTAGFELSAVGTCRAAPSRKRTIVEASDNRLYKLLSRFEHEESLDRTAEQLDKAAATVAAGTRQSLLRGDWLGHALHPLLTDFPLGCWLSAGLLDIFGGRSSRRAAQRLVGAGVLFVPPTIASGLAEYRELGQQRTRRVAVVHAGGNAIVALLYLSSWLARRRGEHARGVMMSALGGLGALGTGYLGGHLSFARGSGMGERGVIDLTSVAEMPAQVNDASDIASSEDRYKVGSLNDDELEQYYNAVVRLKRSGENRSIQGVMRELGESGPQGELRVLDALQTLGSRGRLDLVPIMVEWSAAGNEVNETNETHWYEPVE